MIFHWIKRADGNYLCLETGKNVIAFGSGSSWTVRADGSSEDLAFDSVFASQAAAQDAIRRLVQGVDPDALI
jgi:hypothetical protein